MWEGCSWGGEGKIEGPESREGDERRFGADVCGVLARDDSHFIERDAVSPLGDSGSDAVSALRVPQPVKYVAGIMIRLLYLKEVRRVSCYQGCQRRAAENQHQL